MFPLLVRNAQRAYAAEHAPTPLTGPEGRRTIQIVDPLVDPMSGRGLRLRHDVTYESGAPMEEPNTITRRRMLERGAGVLGAGAVALAGVTLATAVPAGASEHENHDRIVGSWKTTLIVALPGARVEHQLLMFSPGGGLIETITEPNAAGIGAWEKITESKFRVTLHRWEFSSTGAWSGELQTLETYVIDETGDSFTMQGKSVILDTHGHVIFGFSTSSTGQRVRPRPLP